MPSREEVKSLNCPKKINYLPEQVPLEVRMNLTTPSR